MQRDCNNCQNHKQGQHPASVVIDNDELGVTTCRDCLANNLVYFKPIQFVHPLDRHKRQQEIRGEPTKQDGWTPEVGGRKDAGKVGVHLLPTEALEEIAKVLDFGAKKYSAHNWRKGMAWSRVLASMLRHIFAWARGVDNDPETGLSHMAHAGANVVFLLAYILNPKQAAHDDRYKEQQ